MSHDKTIRAGLERTRWRHAVNTEPLPSKQAEREAIAAQIAAFLSQGGIIDQLKGPEEPAPAPKLTAVMDKLFSDTLPDGLLGSYQAADFCFISRTTWVRMFTQGKPRPRVAYEAHYTETSLLRGFALTDLLQWRAQR